MVNVKILPNQGAAIASLYLKDDRFEYCEKGNGEPLVMVHGSLPATSGVRNSSTIRLAGISGLSLTVVDTTGRIKAP